MTTTTTSTALTGKEGICMIEVVDVEWVWEQPWQRCKQIRSAGTGFVIQHHDAPHILTNAHVVFSAIDIRVRLHGSPRRFPAKVVTYAPDVDLAILVIDGEQDQSDAFFGTSPSSLALELAEELPALQDRVHVVGFPTGGRTVCVTEGVVSRIDDVLLASPGDTILSIQIDAAINPGNSGGPAFDCQGKVTGVAFCKSGSIKVDNVGYLIPASVVRAFLGRCEDGTYTLSPSFPYRWHSLENKSLRAAHKVPPEVHGILLTDVSPTVNGALKKGDVLTKIDGHPIADDGQVTLRGDELIQHRYLLRGKCVDEPTVFSVYRDGKHCTGGPPCVLNDIPTIYTRWPNVDHLPDYLILGALVLLPLSHGLMQNKKAGTRILAAYYEWGRRWPGNWDDQEGLVVLTNILAHELSFAYVRSWRRVTAYNGIKVKSLRHIRDMWEESCKAVKAAPEAAEPKFARIELEQDDDIVFDVKAAIDAQSEILEMHQIPKPSVISEPNPKYR